MTFPQTTTICFSLALLAAAFIPFAAAYPAPVSPFCTTAEDKCLCTELVKGGKTWEEAMTNAIHGAIRKVKAGKPIVDNIPAKLPANLEPQLRDQMAQTCKDAFQDVIDNFEMSFALVKNDPIKQLERRIGAPAFSECYDDIGGGPPMPEARKFGEKINKISEALLSVLEKKP